MTQLCDKCGKEAATELIRIRRYPKWLGRNFELCDSCAKPVIDLLEKKT